MFPQNFLRFKNNILKYLASSKGLYTVLEDRLCVGWLRCSFIKIFLVRFGRKWTTLCGMIVACVTSVLGVVFRMYQDHIYDGMLFIYFSAYYVARPLL